MTISHALQSVRSCYVRSFVSTLLWMRPARADARQEFESACRKLLQVSQWNSNKIRWCHKGNIFTQWQQQQQLFKWRRTQIYFFIRGCTSTCPEHGVHLFICTYLQFILVVVVTSIEISSEAAFLLLLLTNNVDVWLWSADMTEWVNNRIKYKIGNTQSRAVEVWHTNFSRNYWRCFSCLFRCFKSILNRLVNFMGHKYIWTVFDCMVSEMGASELMVTFINSHDGWMDGRQGTSIQRVDELPRQPCGPLRPIPRGYLKRHCPTVEFCCMKTLRLFGSNILFTTMDTFSGKNWDRQFSRWYSEFRIHLQELSNGRIFNNLQQISGPR